jgi:hypothetical protein
VRHGGRPFFALPAKSPSARISHQSPVTLPNHRAPFPHWKAGKKQEANLSGPERQVLTRRNAVVATSRHSVVRLERIIIKWLDFELLG